MEIEDQYRGPENSAELYRGFLLYSLRQKFGASGPYSIKSEESIPSNEVLNGYGIYFIFWSEYENAKDIEKQDKIYPLYVGITGRSFKQRFVEHCNRNDGVVHKINKGEWPSSGNLKKPPAGIVAYVLSAELPVAKFLESTFLFTFDFAMNEQENKKVRPQLDLSTKADSLEDGVDKFLRMYKYMKEGVEDADKYTSDLKEAGTNTEHHYQF